MRGQRREAGRAAQRTQNAKQREGGREWVEYPDQDPPGHFRIVPAHAWSGEVTDVCLVLDVSPKKRMVHLVKEGFVLWMRSLEG